MSVFIDSQLNPDAGIDFKKAQKLPGGGSTCDIYKAISQRRKVFVKRLKQEYRNKPLYLAAFDKEYDIGVSLNHKSLPQYREFHEDYIVMDYIDGKTLAEMLKEKDPWLSKEKNVIRMLRELLDVVDYLHQRNIVHCDIKPDNIMITNGNRNLMLIDLDKCYTDWLDDTPGAPSKFYLPIERTGEMDMDFYCVALILERIKNTYPNLKIRNYKRIVETCKKKNITADDILEVIESTKSSNNKNNEEDSKLPLYAGIVGFLTLVLIAIFVPRNNESKASDDIVKTAPIEPVETIKPEIEESPSNLEMSPVAEETPETPIIKEKVIVSSKNVSDEEKGRILDKNFQPMFNRLHAGLTELQSIRQDTALSWVDMLDRLNDFVDLEQPTIEKAYGMITELFPETQSTEVYKTIALSKVYIEYMHRSDTVQQNYASEMKRRRNARK